jgi:hypothetical protein
MQAQIQTKEEFYLIVCQQYDRYFQTKSCSLQHSTLKSFSKDRAGPPKTKDE